VRLQWTAEADRAFSHLRALFTSAPVLAHPNPSLAFIVEVDASEAGIGAVLSFFLSPVVSSLCLVSLRTYKLWRPCLHTSSDTMGCLRI
jgi:hypothetical protein